MSKPSAIQLQGCPTDRQLVHVLDSISAAVTADLRHDFEKFKDLNELNKAIAALCNALRALWDCHEFWSRLWIEGVVGAFEFIDLGQVNEELNYQVIAHLAHVLHSLGMDQTAAIDFVEQQVNEARAAFTEISELYESGPNDFDRLRKLRDIALQNIQTLRDSVCDPLTNRLREEQSDQWLLKMLMGAKRALWGVLTGSIGGHPLLLRSEIPSDESLLQFQHDDAMRHLLVAYSIVSMHLIFSGGTPAPAIEYAPV